MIMRFMLFSFTALELADRGAAPESMQVRFAAPVPPAVVPQVSILSFNFLGIR
jgi:hypothetical protein